MPFDWKNPYVLGGAALLLIVMVFFRGGGSSAGASGVASQQSADSSNVALAGLQYAFMGHEVDAQSSLGVYQAGADASIIGQAFGWLTNMGNNQVQRQNIAAGVAVNKNDNLTATALAQIGQVTAFGTQDRMNSGALALATEQDNTTIRVNGDNNDLMARLSPELAQIQADTARSLATTSANTAVTTAGIQAQIASQQSSERQSQGMFDFMGKIFSGLTTPQLPSMGGGSSGGSGGSSGGMSSILGAGLGALLAL